MSKPVYYRKKAAGKKPAKKSVYIARAGNPMPIIRGKGKYKKDYGARLGAVIGEGIQEGLSQLLPGITKMIGFGDYAPVGFAKSIKSNVLSMGLDPPSIQNTSMKNVIIRHREYLGDVITGGAGIFNNTSYNINPGLPETFPWLSQIAVSFEQYKVRGMIFEFKSTSADALNSTNTALGTVIMATQYDSSEAPFGNKQTMENHQFSSSARQSSSMLHPIECARSEAVLSNLYIRNGTESNTDLRFSDFGIFQIATMGQQGTNINIGELWLTYEIELLKPKMVNSNGGASGLYTGHIRTLSGVTPTNPFGTASPASIQGNLGLTISGANNNVVNLPGWLAPGQQFMLIFAVYGTSAALTGPTFTLSSGMFITTIWNGDSSTIAWNTGTTAPQLVACINFVIQNNTTQQSITISGGAYPTGTVSSDLFITSYVGGVTMDTDVIKEENLEELVKSLKERVNKLESEKLTIENSTQCVEDDPNKNVDRTLTADQYKEYRMIHDKLSKIPGFNK